MIERAEEVREQALRLPIEARAALAADLLASLDGEPEDDVQTAWSAEVERRAQRLRSGEDRGHAWDDVRTRLRADLER